MELNFNVDGKYITELARQQFYQERKPYEKVEELLLSCMCGTNISITTLKKYVEDILKFKRKFVGNTKDNNFCLVEDEEIPPALTNLVKNYNFIKQYGKIPFEVCEYGFINPRGKYIPVEWSNHGSWADEYLNETYSEEQKFKFMCTAKGQINNMACSLSTDILVNQLNWILIDNPRQEEGIIQTGNRITKAQKETLYDYLTFFNRQKEADELYKE